MTRRNHVVMFAKTVLGVFALAPALLLGGCKKKVVTVPDAGPADAAPAETGDAATDEGDAGLDSGAPTATAHVVVQASPFADGGEWTGSYVCAQGGTSLELQLRGTSSVTGVFTFRKGKTLGQFKMSGTYDSAHRHLHMNPGEWLTHPGSYTTVGLDGVVSADGHTLSGSVQGPGCTTFSVHH